MYKAAAADVAMPQSKMSYIKQKRNFTLCEITVELSVLSMTFKIDKNQLRAEHGFHLRCSHAGQDVFVRFCLIYNNIHQELFIDFTSARLHKGALHVQLSQMLKPLRAMHRSLFHVTHVLPSECPFYSILNCFYFAHIFLYKCSI